MTYDGRGGSSSAGEYPGDSNWRGGEHETGRWEAWSGRRGDLARALFYMDVRYEGGTHGVSGAEEPDLELTNNTTEIADSDQDVNLSYGYMGIKSDLLAWHEEDPVDGREQLRNELVWRYQRNRNPFVDHPEWVRCIYEDICPGADLAVVKDDGWAEAVPGETVDYRIEVSNLGPDGVTGAVVEDVFDPTRFDVPVVTWVCAPAAGSGAGTGCPASGTAADLAAGVGVDVASGEAVVFEVAAPVLVGATGDLVNTATVAAPEGVLDRVSGNDGSTDSDSLLVLGACGSPDERVLHDHVEDGSEEFTACVSITAGPSFRVEAPGDVTFRAGSRIVLRDGFSVGQGARFRAVIDGGLGGE